MLESYPPYCLLWSVDTFAAEGLDGQCGGLLYDLDEHDEDEVGAFLFDQMGLVLRRILLAVLRGLRA